MGTNNGNGTQRPKLEPALNQEVRVRLLKDKPFTGENSVGKYYLYSVQNVNNAEELAFFAPAEVHQIIEDKKLTKGSEFIIKKVPYQNGKKIGSKLELSLVSVAAAPPPVSSQERGDNLKQLLLTCILDAAAIVKEAGVQFSNDELQKLATTLFIQRTRSL